MEKNPLRFTRLLDRGRKLFTLPLPVFFSLAFTLVSFTVLFLFVDLKPKVEENFFFSSDDPQFLADRKIAEIFPQPPQIIIAVKGDLRSADYLEKIRKLSDELKSLDEVFGLQSLTHGPKDLDDALKSPLWKRILISEEGDSSLLSVFIKDVPTEVIVPKVEEICAAFDGPGFDLMISGAPYVVELIQRKLLGDLKVFTLAALVIFGLVILSLFRSWGILAGIMISCLNASVVTLILNQVLGMKIGLLTANLSTIVFVITLSSIIFFTFNWKLLGRNSNLSSTELLFETIKLTIVASFWSIATTFLGFASLFFVQAEPLRQLGMAGSLGTLVAFGAAYGIYPWFLKMEPVKQKKAKEEKEIKWDQPFFKDLRMNALMRRRHGWIVLALAVLGVAAATGLGRVNTDPSLLSYFRKGGELRNGLEYIDRNGGSSPLNLVIRDKAGEKFSSGSVYKRLWKLHEALEAGPAVGTVVSLPIIMAEGKRSPLAFFLTWEWLLDIMESQNFGEVAKYFVTGDREQAFFMLRMEESRRESTRLENIREIEEIVRAHDFVPELVGGLYLLQGKLSQLILSSLISGLSLLIFLFIIMAWFLSRSLRVTAAMGLGLAFIPVTMLGILGHFRVPIDVISSPAANIAIGMGVDSMIHMLVRARILQKRGLGVWESWSKARSQLWKPVLGNMFIVGAGFGIFILSNFPPTQRFGISVVLGSSLSPLAALFILPFLAAAPLPRKN